MNKIITIMVAISLYTQTAKYPTRLTYPLCGSGFENSLCRGIGPFLRSDYQIWIDRRLNFHLWLDYSKWSHNVERDDEGAWNGDFNSRPSVCEDLAWKYVPMDC
jgi:hypothetical protein